MSNNQLNDQTIAFAGICQVAQMVQGIARKDELDDDSFIIMLNSILNMNPTSILNVYQDDMVNLNVGLKTIVTQLGDTTNNKDPELTRYIVSLLNIERRLNGKPKVMNELGNRINQANRQVGHFELTSDTMIANIASIYTDVVSPLGTKIQIAGEPSILKQTGNQNKIRALLLAGVRATVLWRQAGGKRRNILFKRRGFVANARQILKQL